MEYLLKKAGSIKYDKLIRNRIPEIIETNGSRAVVEVLDTESYKKYLDNVPPKST